MDWQPLTPEQLKKQTQMYLDMSHGSVELLAHKCAVLAHRLTKYEDLPDKSQDNAEINLDSR
jgi:hypothetical protein